MASSGGPFPGKNTQNMPAAYENVVILEPPIFPSLIWDLILDMFDDSKDVSNVVLAIPQLAPLVRKKAHKLRFGEVLPCLIPYLNRTELLDCRLVSTKWSRGVEQFLGSHPGLIHKGWIPLGANLDEDGMEDSGLINGFFGVRELNTREMIDEFLEDMEGHPASRNPILGRKLRLAPDLRFPRIMNVIDLGRYWDGADQLLQKFGEHVWDFEIGYPRVAQNPTTFSQPILNCFRHLPHLKHFTLGYGFDSTRFTDPPNSRNFWYGATGAVNDFIESGTAPSPNLESFEIYFGNCPPQLINFLLSWFSPSLTKLTLHRHDHPKRGLPKLIFPKLVDLSIEDSTSKKVLLRLLRNLDVPQVSKLKLSLRAPYTKYMLGSDLFPVLRKMSNLTSLTLKCSAKDSRINEEYDMSTTTLTMASVKSLKISSNNSQLAYDFLSCFPSLEELKIKGPPPEEQHWWRRSSTVRLAEYLVNGRIYKSNVWELLSNLKELTVKSGSSLRRYTRADKYRYDNLSSGCRHDAFGY